MHIIKFQLSATAPFRLDLTVWALRRRSRNIVDYWDGFCYTRVFIIEGSPVKVEVRQKTKKAQLSVIAYSHHPMHKLKSKITDLLNVMLGLQVRLRLVL